MPANSSCTSDAFSQQAELAHQRLTRRQREVANLLRLGIPISDIAEQLFLSIGTVRGHIRDLHVQTDTHDLVTLLYWINQHAHCCVDNADS